MIKPILFLTGALLCFHTAFAQPVITSISTATADVGTGIVVSGTNFSPVASDNIVYFGATRGNVLNASATSLTVEVPHGASYRPLTLTNATNGLSAQSMQFFSLTFPVCGIGAILTNSFGPPANFATGGSSARQAEFADLDGDGKSDMVVSNFLGEFVSIFLNNGVSGAVNFAPKTDIMLANNPIALALADIDGDGKTDIILSYNVTNSIAVLRNTSSLGNISFAPQLVFAAGDGPFSIAVGDLDLDGKQDVVVANWAGGNAGGVSILRNTSSIGSISFATASFLATGTGPQAPALGDLNGDGKLDLAVVNRDTRIISVFENASILGTIFFTNKVDYQTTSAADIKLADFDGDGKIDLVTSGLSTTGLPTSMVQLTIMKNISVGPAISFAAMQTFPCPQTMGIAVGDINGDGKPEVLAASRWTQDLILFRNSSTTSGINMAPYIQIPTGSTELWASAIADLDGDGRSEIISAPFTGTGVTIHKNLSYPPDVATNINHVNCDQMPVGSIAVTVNSGISPFSYSWTPGGATTASISNLPSGTYTCQIIDAAGCDTTITAVVLQTTSLASTIDSKTDVSCFGGMDGSASISVSGGTAPYTYSWDTNPTAGTTSISNLPAGIYTCTISDINNCSATQEVEIIEPDELIIQMAPSNVTCESGSDGAVEANISGGTFPYSISWNPSGTNPVLTNLPIGTYSAMVTDNNGCQANASTTIGWDHPNPVVSLGPDIEQCGGNVTLDAQNEGNNIQWQDNSSNSLFLVQVSGTYHVKVTDVNGCSTSDTVEVAIHPDPLVEFNLEPENFYCLNSPDIVFSAATPPGGTFSGTGTSGNTFSPSAAGEGLHTISYTYTDPVTSCEGKALLNLRVEGCVGLNKNIFAPRIEAYPNPSTGLFYISSTHPGTLIVLNEIGQEIRKFQIADSGSEILKVELNLPTGLYHLIGNIGGKTFTRKLVVMH